MPRARLSQETNHERLDKQRSGKMMLGLDVRDQAAGKKAEMTL